MSWPEWEGLASSHLDEAGIGSPVDPWLVAWSLDLEVLAGAVGCDAYLDLVKREIRVDPTYRRDRQGFRIAHECAHALLLEAGMPDTEPACDAVASCLTLPRIDFMRDRRATGGDLFALRELHPYASHEAILRRMVSLDAAVAWVWDVAPVERRYRIVTPGMRWAHRAPTPLELEAMTHALDAREHAEPIGGVRAWPVIEGDFVRVVSLAALDVLTAW